MKGTGAKRNVCPGSCVSTGAKFPVAPVESAPMTMCKYYAYVIHKPEVHNITTSPEVDRATAMGNVHKNLVMIGHVVPKI